jgi:selenium metabolism protein YedF
MPMEKIDVRSLACPGPVLKLRDLFDAGERKIAMHVADELSRSNVTRFATSRGAEVVVEDHPDGSFVVNIVAGDTARDAQPGEEALLTDDGSGGVTLGPTIVQVTAGTMGSGNDELGALLLRSFLKTQAQLERTPDAIIFYNDGVKLCCDGSLLLEDLKTLESNGVEIIACGTCLNFFELAADLRVGRVTDMLEIASLLAGAAKVVRP